MYRSVRDNFQAEPVDLHFSKPLMWIERGRQASRSASRLIFAHGTGDISSQQPTANGTVAGIDLDTTQNVI
jgi:hypothetical protein